MAKNLPVMNAVYFNFFFQSIKTQQENQSKKMKCSAGKVRKSQKAYSPLSNVTQKWRLLYKGEKKNSDKSQVMK